MPRWNSKTLWHDVSTNSNFKIDERMGTETLCDGHGVPIKPSNAKITGRFNFEERASALEKFKADLDEVRSPKCLKSKLSKIYYAP